MPLLHLLAQQEPKPADDTGLTLWEQFSAWISTAYGVTTPVAVLIFIGILVVLTILVERVSVALVRKLTSKTDTKVDDVFVGGIPGIVRSICVMLALRVVAVVFTHGQRQETLLTVLHGLTVAVVGILAARLLLKMVSAWIDSKPAMKPLGPGIKLTIKVLVIPVILLAILQALGIKIEAFLAALGIGALAVGLALQDVLKNIFAGVQLVLDQPVRAGDFIQLANGTRGTVTEMGLRSTKLITVENNTVILPNSTLANEIITNTDLLDQSYAHHVLIGIAYGCDTRRVAKVLLEEASDVAKTVPGFLPEEAQVFLLTFGDSAIQFRVTLRLTRFSGSNESVSELNHRIYARLQREGIEMAYPTRTVFIRNEPVRGTGEGGAAKPAV